MTIIKLEGGSTIKLNHTGDEVLRNTTEGEQCATTNSERITNDNQNDLIEKNLEEELPSNDILHTSNKEEICARLNESRNNFLKKGNIFMLKFMLSNFINFLRTGNNLYRFLFILTKIYQLIAVPYVLLEYLRPLHKLYMNGQVDAYDYAIANVILTIQWLFVSSDIYLEIPVKPKIFVVFGMFGGCISFALCSSHIFDHGNSDCTQQMVKHLLFLIASEVILLCSIWEDEVECGHRARCLERETLYEHSKSASREVEQTIKDIPIEKLSLKDDKPLRQQECQQVNQNASGKLSSNTSREELTSLDKNNSDCLLFNEHVDMQEISDLLSTISRRSEEHITKSKTRLETILCSADAHIIEPSSKDTINSSETQPSQSKFCEPPEESVMVSENVDVKKSESCDIKELGQVENLAQLTQPSDNNDQICLVENDTNICNKPFVCQEDTFPEIPIDENNINNIDDPSDIEITNDLVEDDIESARATEECLIEHGIFSESHESQIREKVKQVCYINELFPLSLHNIQNRVGIRNETKSEYCESVPVPETDEEQPENSSTVLDDSVPHFETDELMISLD